MTQTETDFDPTEADLLAMEDESDETPVTVEDDFDWDFDSNLEDDRYSNEGVPSWSAWA